MALAKITSAAVVSSIIGVFGASVISAYAAGDFPKERQLLMKSVGASMKVAAGMAKGNTEFDLEGAKLALKTMNGAALQFGSMFPEGSETGAETEASPAIWADRAGFDKAAAKFAADTSGEISDEASFKAVFGAAASNCGACHKAYRVKK